MATLIAERILTGAEFSRLPDPPDGGKMELVRGKIVVMPPTGPIHGERSADLVYFLAPFIRGTGIGRLRTETGYWLGADPDYIRAPDLSFVSEARAIRETLRDGFVDGPPELAIEVISPTNREREILEKVEDYLLAGVRRVWAVRPERSTITVHRNGEDRSVFARGDTLGSDDAGFEVAGFALKLSELFR